MVNTGNLNWISNYIWGITDDVLRDLYVRGKYRDVILPMTVLRRLDAVLEDSKQSVLDMKKTLDDAGVAVCNSSNLCGPPTWSSSPDRVSSSATVTGSAGSPAP